MSVKQIPNLTAATSLNGTEQLEAVQSGTSVRLTVNQIGTYVVSAYYPATGIYSVTANSPLSSTTIGTAVTISLPSQSITNAYLATMAANTVKANLSGGTSTPTDVSPSAILDTFGTQVGSILYRGSSGWTALTSGTNGQLLKANGTTSPPSWSSIVLGTMASQNADAVAITGGTIAGVAITTSTINQTTIGATTPSTGAFTNLSASGAVALGTISSGTWQGTPVAVTYGGTGADNAASARTNLGAAASGANTDITSLTGLTTPLSAPQGGSGFGSYTTGDLLYASSSTALSRLNDVATGNSLISGGVGVAPTWGKIGLTTHVSGTLPVTSGGTGQNSPLTQYGVIYGDTTSAMGFTAAGTTGQILTANTGSAPTWSNGSITIGSTNIVLGTTTLTLAGLTSVTLTQDPTLALQASTKQYVDNQVSTVSNTTFHAASNYATTAALSANYANGTGGVGATLTNSIALAALTIDGYTFTATDVTNATRVLVKDQASGLQNGIYVVTNQGSALVAWVLTRATDFNTVGTGPNFIETGAATFVTGGSVNSSTSWSMTASGTITVGSTSLTWVQISATGSITVTSPLTKVGSVISLGTVPTTLGGTGLTTLTAYNVMLGNGTGNVAFAAPGTTGYPLLSTGASSNPAFGQLSLTAGVTGTLPVANGGTGTATAFTTGSVVFAGPSGVYAQDNAKFFWDDTNNRLGINTAIPNANMTIVSNTQTTAVPSSGSLPAGTDLYIMGANAANTRITQDAFGSGNYSAYTGRQARGTAASPTASQTGDILVEFTGRGYGATGFSSSSVARIDLEAAEAFTDTAQGTYISFHTSALGAATAVEKFRMGPSGQWGIGGATYGTSGYSFVSGGSSAAPTWSQVSLTAGVTGTLPVANGGTNITSYAVGDLIYASGATTLSKLAAVATGNVLRSGGLVTAPAWGQVVLTTDVTGVLPIANGGTNSSATATAGGIGYGTGTAHAYTAAGTSGQILTSGGTGVPTWTTLSGAAVTSLTAGTNISVSASTGAVTVSTVANPAFGTSVTSPVIIGGVAASSSLVLQSTTGVGTTDSILFKVGNNGAVTAMSIASGGTVTIGTLNLTNALGIAYGGTGQTTAAAGFNALSPITSTGDLIIGTGVNTAGRLAIGANGYVLTSDGTTATWSASTGGVASFSAGSTGLTPSTATTGAITLAGTLVAGNGGTGFSTYATGDIIYASATNTLSKLTAGTNGYVLTLASGVPAWAAASGGGTYNRTTFTATAGQTSFTAAYTVGYVEVYLNGVLLSPADYTATSGTAIVLATAAAVGDLVDVIATAALSSGGTVNSGTAGQLAYYATTGTAVSSSSGISIDASQNVTVVGTLAMGSSFLRNRIINGNMYVAQRATTATVTAGTTVPTVSTGYPCVDRWFVYSTGANVTAAQVAGSGSNRNLLQITGAASVTAVGVGQRIETLNSYDLSGQTCTLSVSMANSLLTTVTWTASYANTTDTFGTIGTPTKTQISTGTFTVNSTLTRYTVNISVPAAATTGIEILFTVGAQISGTWQVGNVQFEAGSVATPFEKPIYSQQLIDCQRYYFTYAAAGKDFQESVVRGGLTAAEMTAICPVTMRAAPSLVLGSSPYGRLVGYSTSFVATVVNVTGLSTGDNSSLSAIHLVVTNASMTQAAAAASCSFDTTGATGDIGFSAEL